MEMSLCGRVNIYAEVRIFSRYLKIFFFFKQHSVAYWESPKYLEKLVIQNKNSQSDNI